MVWQQWVDAYNYDKSNSISTFRRLTDDHFYLNSASRMRNHLADDVLGEEMMNLIQVFEECQYAMTGSCKPTIRMVYLPKNI
jgi:hypothetical protein